MTASASGGSAASYRVVAGHNSSAIAGLTEMSILGAVDLCSCKFLWRDTAGQHQETQLGNGLQKMDVRGTYCAMNLERQNPELGAALSPEWVDRASIDRINLYISPRGSGTPMHLDVRWIVVVQLSGSKLWQVGPGPALANPLSNVVADELAGEAHHNGKRLDLPDRMLFVLLRPGDWLLLPWGTWHGTYSQHGSVSATLAFAHDVTPIFPADFAAVGTTRLIEGPRLLC